MSILKDKLVLTLVLIAGLLGALSVGAWAQEPIRLFVNGVEVHSDVPPQVINGRTMVPAAALAQALGAKVEWDAANRAVMVTALKGGGAPTDLPSSGSPSQSASSNVTISKLYSEGSPYAGGGSGVTLWVEGKVNNPPPKYGLIVQIGVPGHGTLMTIDEYGYSSSGISEDGSFKVYYRMQEFEDELAGAIVAGKDVKAVVVPDSVERFKVLAVAKSDYVYAPAQGLKFNTYSIICSRGPDDESPTFNIASHYSGPDPDTSGVFGGPYVLCYHFAAKEGQLTGLELSKGGRILKSYSSGELAGMMNKLPAF
ncbi:MAG: stalk domain-containing protein [Syntrophomonadaceae bacterium]